METKCVYLYQYKTAGKSTAAVGAAGKGAVKREKKVSQFAPGYAQWRIFRHFRQDIFAYFS